MNHPRGIERIEVTAAFQRAMVARERVARLLLAPHTMVVELEAAIAQFGRLRGRALAMVEGEGACRLFVEVLQAELAAQVPGWRPDGAAPLPVLLARGVGRVPAEVVVHAARRRARRVARRIARALTTARVAADVAAQAAAGVEVVS